MSKFLSFLLILLIHSILCEINNSELVSVSVIFRHGDRTIRNNSYPNDPYKSINYWPQGFGQLTNRGKLRHFKLGQWFRERYETFLSKLDLKEDVYVLSSDVERTKMSAESHLAGLFPLNQTENWNPALKGYPIPIHIIPKKSDNLLLFDKPCPKHTNILTGLKNASQFFKINEDNRDLYEYLSINTGSLVNDITCTAYHYKTLLIENENGFILPNWTKSVFPSKMAPMSDLSFAVPTFTNELARLKVGPLINKIAEQLENRNSSKKFTIYSAHDVTVASVLNALSLFEYHFPPYAAAVIFELRKIGDEHFVNIFYRNGSVLQNKTLANCDFDCPVDKFLDIIRPVRLSMDQWEEECTNAILK